MITDHILPFASYIFNNFKAIRCEYKKVLNSTLNIHSPCIQKTSAHTHWEGKNSDE